MKIIDLKCRPEEFQAILDRTKTFDIRIEDGRIAESGGFQVGDVLLLREYDEHNQYPGDTHYTGRVTIRTISYLMRGGNQKGRMRELLPEGRVIMSLETPNWEIIQRPKEKLEYTTIRPPDQ